MNNKKLTVTIGIPAYNEEQNIASLLVRLLQQKTVSVTLKEIIIVSDGSTDKTAKIAQALKDKRIVLIERKRRIGLSATQNEIVKRAVGDILILLDADVLPSDDLLIEELAKPVRTDSAVGLVGANIHPLRPHSLLERVLAYSHIFRKHLYKRIDNIDNIYLCHGRGRAFAKALYKQITWPELCPEDAYSYLFCYQRGYRFVYQPKAKILFRAPSTLHDHIMQSKRFVAGIHILKKHFPSNIVEENFRIPLPLIVSASFTFARKGPFSFLAYLGINFYIHFINKDSYQYKTAHEISLSTKRLISSYNLGAR